jgi:hypothetical protein
VDPVYILANVVILLVLVDSWWSAFSRHAVPDW